MQSVNRNITLNLTINETYFPLFKDHVVLRELANLAAAEYKRDLLPIEQSLPDWKQSLVEKLYDLLKTEDEGRIFVNHIYVNFSDGYQLGEVVTQRTVVKLEFVQPDVVGHAEYES